MLQGGSANQPQDICQELYLQSPERSRGRSLTRCTPARAGHQLKGRERPGREHERQVHRHGVDLPPAGGSRQRFGIRSPRSLAKLLVQLFRSLTCRNPCNGSTQSVSRSIPGSGPKAPIHTARRSRGRPQTSAAYCDSPPFTEWRLSSSYRRRRTKSSPR